MRKNQREKAAQHTATITKASRRIKTQTGRVMAAATVLVESEKRNPYPMQVIGFDLLALELMIHHRGERFGGLSQGPADSGSFDFNRHQIFRPSR